MRNNTTLHRIASNGLDFATWYPTIGSQWKTIAKHFERYNLRQCVEIFGILSPRKAFVRNIRAAFNYLQSGKLFNNEMRTIRRSLELYKLGHYAKHGFPYKVGRFIQAILGDDSAIVVDTWICKALNLEQERLKNKQVRRQVERRLLNLSDSLGLSPSASQACLWAGIIREHNRTPAFPDLLAEYQTFQRYNYSYPLSGTIK